MADLNKLKTLLKNNKETAAIVSKLITDKDERYDLNNGNKVSVSELPSIMRISNNIVSKMKHSGNLLELFPDLKFCAKIIVSSIISPNDLLTTNLNIDAPESLKIQDSIKKNITNIIKEHIEDNYKIESKLYDIIMESLFTKGCCVYAVIPEASVDDVINRHELSKRASNGESILENLYMRNKNGEPVVESYSGFLNGEYREKKKSKFGYLGEVSKETLDSIKHYNDNSRVIELTEYGDKSIATESLSFTYSMENKQEKINIPLPLITDDFTILKTKDQHIDNVLVSLEDAMLSSLGQSRYVEMGGGEGGEESELESIFKIMTDKIDNDDTFILVKDGNMASRKSIGKPMVTKIPGEAVIPLHAPGEPHKHVGYFVILDELGTPINIETEKAKLNAISTINTSLGYTQQDVEYMNSRANRALNGVEIPDETLKDNDKIYSYIVRDMIKDKIKNGGFEGLAELNEDMNLYQMMFHRALKKMKTQVLFLPKSLVQYFAFDYRDNGVGLGEFEKISLLTSIRGMLFVTSILATVKAAVPQNDIDIELDDLDQYGQETLDKIIQTFIKNREPTCDLGMNSVQDIVQWFVEYQYKININAAGLPNMKIDKSGSNYDVHIPDEDSLKKIADIQYLALGVTPEMVDKGADVEFAQTIINNHLLLSKNCKARQDLANEMISNLYRIILKNDFALRDKLKALVKTNKKGILNGFESLLSKYNPNTGQKMRVTLDPNKFTDEDFDKIADYILLRFEKDMFVYLPEVIYNDANAKFNNLKARFEEIDTITDVLFDDAVMETVLGSDNTDVINEIKGVVKANLKKKATTDNGFYKEITELFTNKTTAGLNDLSTNIFIENIEDYKQLIVNLVDSYKNKQAVQNALKTEFKEYEDIKGVSSSGGGYSSYDSNGGGDDGGSNDGGDNGGDSGGDGGGDPTESKNDIDDILKDL